MDVRRAEDELVWTASWTRKNIIIILREGKLTSFFLCVVVQEEDIININFVPLKFRASDSRPMKRKNGFYKFGGVFLPTMINCGFDQVDFVLCSNLENYW